MGTLDLGHTVSPDLSRSRSSDPPGARIGGDRVLDGLDNRIINLLLDRIMTNRELAAEVGASDVTVAARVKRLVADRALVFTAVFDWEKAGFEWLAIAKIVVENRPTRAVAEEIAMLPNCTAVAIVFGGADILAYFLVKERTDLDDLVTRQLGPVAGVGSASIDLAIRTVMTPLARKLYFRRNPAQITLPNPIIGIDYLDRQLLQILVDDSRLSIRSIARRVPVSETTVRARIHRLTRSGLVEIVAMTVPSTLGIVGDIATVELRVAGPKISTIASDLLQLPQTLFVATTVGSSDISVTIGANDHGEILDTVLGRIRALDGVRSTDTLQFIDLVRFDSNMKRLTMASL